ncbi:MAG: AAA family ATPase [Bacilli bacterium]|nr:AAA family ATPase [Bacilli bacterium]
MKRAFVMLGCPGSGKSTWVKSQGIPGISRDDIRIELGYCKEGEKFLGDKAQEDKVTELHEKRLAELSDAGANFALDNTNVNPYFRKPLLKKLRELGYHVIGVKMCTSLETCLSRRASQIPEEVVKRMYKQMDTIDPTEFDEFIEAPGE